MEEGGKNNGEQWRKGDRTMEEGREIEQWRKRERTME